MTKEDGEKHWDTTWATADEKLKWSEEQVDPSTGTKTTSEYFKLDIGLFEDDQEAIGNRKGLKMGSKDKKDPKLEDLQGST